MPTPRLFRVWLHFIIRLRLSIARVAFAFQTHFASLSRAILTFVARRGGSDQSGIRLHANDVPSTDDSRRERPQIAVSEGPQAGSGTLAAQPVRPTADWQNVVAKYEALTLGHRFEFKRISATPEGGSKRYKPGTINRSDVESLNIPVGQKKLLSALPEPPNGWSRNVHPEGNVLYYHEELRIHTESDVIHHGMEVLYCAVTLIRKAMQSDDVILDELTEIVLNVENNRRCHYYFVDHKNQLLFWLEQVPPQKLDKDVQGITQYSHIRYLVEGQYWSHCEYYPYYRTLPKHVYEYLRGMLNYTKTDMMTADTSSSPFAQDELVAILDLVNSLKDDEEISDPHTIWIIARLMAFFTENQFLHFFGQSCARLNADTPLFGQQTWHRHTAFKMINMFLFGSPNEHATRLRRVWVDGIIIQPRWRDFINRLTAELGRYTIFSTVMLAVNFNFLSVAISSTSPIANPIETIIYCSIVSTIASIVFSFSLLNVYSNPGLLVATHAAGAMRTLGQTKTGMACLAITHSLPIACLIWSIALFSIALAVHIFGYKEIATVTTLGAECLIIVSLTVVSTGVMRVISGREDEEDGEYSDAGENTAPAIGPAQC